MSFITDFFTENVLSVFSPKSEWVIYVTTGDCRKAGTNACVFIRLYDEKGNASEEIKLDNKFTDDFKLGQTDIFDVSTKYVEKLDMSTKIARIELWKDEFLVSNDWFVDKIVVENRAANLASVFPMFRWIESKFHYNVMNYGTSLPQDDPFKDQRDMELKRKREKYVYDQKTKDGPVQVEEVPKSEKFSFDYQFDIVARSARLVVASKIILKKTDEWSSIEDMQEIYSDRVFEKPSSFDYWDNDVHFGLMRIASLNPTLIERVLEIPKKFPVTDDLLAPMLEGLSIQKAIELKRLFMVDLHMVEGLPTKEGYKIAAPIALFFENDAKQLKPVAIQLFQTPSAENPIFTPMNPPYTWAVAKMWFNNADANYHQSISHLGFTHLLVEGIVVATNRNLSPNHPIYKLLAPHFLYIIAINDLAVNVLISEGGWVDRTMVIGSKGMVAFYTKMFKSWRLDTEGSLPADLEKRGLGDEKVLPSYHYRSDGLLLFNAIKKYVENYVALYYTDEVLAADPEIQSWAAELVKERDDSRGGVGLLGVPGNGELTNTAQLSQILTSVIYTSSVTHAAVNFPQYNNYGFPVNYPGLLRGEPPKDTTKALTEMDVVNAAPAKSAFLDIMSITKVLSEKGTNSLGVFEVDYVYDPKAKAVLKEFREDLDKIGQEIERRNKHRYPVYDYLLPKNIPNAISI